MRIISSKLIRIYNREKIPYPCYCLHHLPYSLSHTCDCINFCKFLPKSNTETFQLKSKYKQTISFQFVKNKQ